MDKTLPPDSSAEADAGVRLQKLIAHRGLASRRNAEMMIKGGLVRVNGQLVTEPGTKVDPDKDIVSVEGRTIPNEPEAFLFLFYKPRGIVSTLHDPEGRPTLREFFPAISPLIHVGRLDFQSEGVLLLTNNGDLAQRLLHPRFAIRRTYLAKIQGVVTETHLERLRSGMVRLDGRSVEPVELELERVTQTNAWYRITLTEGRNREVRRLFEALGYFVLKLTRIAFGSLDLSGLEPGEYRLVSPTEIETLLSGHPSEPRKTHRSDARRAFAPGSARMPGPRERRPDGRSHRPDRETGVRPRPERRGASESGSRFQSRDTRSRPRPDAQDAEKPSRTGRGFATHRDRESRSGPDRETGVRARPERRGASESGSRFQSRDTRSRPRPDTQDAEKPSRTGRGPASPRDRDRRSGPDRETGVRPRPERRGASESGSRFQSRDTRSRPRPDAQDAEKPSRTGRGPASPRDRERPGRPGPARRNRAPGEGARSSRRRPGPGEGTSSRSVRRTSGKKENAPAYEREPGRNSSRTPEKPSERNVRPARPGNRTRPGTSGRKPSGPRPSRGPSR